MTFSVRAVSTALVGLTFVAACHTVEDGTDKAPVRNPLSLTSSGVVPGPSPTPNPNPTPTPTPTPQPTPTPEPTGGAVAKVAIGVTFVVCNDEGVPNSENATVVPVGCKVHMDMNLKDANKNPTDYEDPPDWTYSRPDMVEVKYDPWGPILIVKKNGDFWVEVTVDGVKSNTYYLHFGDL